MDHFTEYIIKQKKSKFQVLATIGMTILLNSLLGMHRRYGNTYRCGMSFNPSLYGNADSSDICCTC